MKKYFLSLAFFVALVPQAMADDGDVERLIGALLAETPVIDDLRELSDTIGGRPTGSESNERAVEWALAKFADAGVSAKKEAFTMPREWSEESASARVRGKNVSFEPAIAAKTFSTGTTTLGLGGKTAALLDGAKGTAEDFKRLGESARDAWVLIELPVLDDIAGLDGLFREYTDGVLIENNALAAGVGGIVYMSSRPKNLLYRHLPSTGVRTDIPIIVMEREAAQRAQRLLQDGIALELTLRLNIDDGGSYTSHNVVGEITGSDRPDEIVLIGAHIDSHGLGTGALDNGSNVSMVIDIARQITALGLQPRRTIRFALFNGEEQGLFGSLGYTLNHADELDDHIMASSFDIGTGRITGFFTNGRGDIIPALDRVLGPVSALGPFTHVNHPVVGTDNFDFMMQGVANLIAIQESANYASNYHAESDTFDKVDQRQLKLNAAVAAAVIYGLADLPDDAVTWSRQSCEEVRALVSETDLSDQMQAFGDIWADWTENRRGCVANATD